MTARRRELFPPDRGLQARMLLAMAATPLSLAAAIALVAWLLPSHWLWAILIGGAIGLAFVVHDLVKALRPGRTLPPGPEVLAIVDRLCVAADLPRPEVSVHPDLHPNSWIVDVPRRPPHLFLTQGLVRLLEPAELEAVIAHELAHVAHRDAVVMTLAGLPADALTKGTYVGWHSFAPMLVGMVGQLGSASLARHRELTADAGAAALTGRPSALASALLKVSGTLAEIPKQDLREVAGFRALNLLPVGSERGGLWRTHPSVERRVAALERMERRLAGARPGTPRD